MSPFMILVPIGCLLLGLVVGGIYFAAMWRSAELFARGARIPTAIGLVAGRFALILAVLATAALHGGAVALLATGLGIAIARIVAVRRVKAMAP